MSGTYQDINVPPTLISFLVLMEKIKHYFSGFKKKKKLEFYLSFPSQNSRKWIAKLRKFNRSFDS